FHSFIISFIDFFNYFFFDYFRLNIRKFFVLSFQSFAFFTFCFSLLFGLFCSPFSLFSLLYSFICILAIFSYFFLCSFINGFVTFFCWYSFFSRLFSLLILHSCKKKCFLLTKLLIKIHKICFR